MNRKVIVPEWLMNRITAMCDVMIEDGDGVALVKTAKAIREEINKGFDYLKEDKTLINIADAVYQNKKKAIEVLKEKPNGEVVFNECEEVEDLESNGSEPYVVCDNGDGTLSDCMVLKAKYDDTYGIMLLVTASDYSYHPTDWVTISETLCNTENNVYEGIMSA